MSLRAYRIAPTDSTTFHPRLIGTRGAVASNSYLSANAGADILKAGGNAIDAAVAMTLVEGLVNPQMNTLGGECPILLRLAGRVARHRAERQHGGAGAPPRPKRSSPGAARTCRTRTCSRPACRRRSRRWSPRSSRWGTMSLREVSAPARELAANGFAVSAGLRQQHKFGLVALEDKFKSKWPASAKLYLPGGAVPEVGQLLQQRGAGAYARLPRERARPARRLLPRRRRRRDREVFEANATGFSPGRISRASRRESSSRSACASATSSSSSAASGRRGRRSCRRSRSCRASISKRMGPASADYCHLLIEAMKLAFADREQYYGDPQQAMVPGEVLLSDSYTRRTSEAHRHAQKQPRACGPATRGATPRCCRRTSASRRRTGARARCMSTRSTRRATWLRSRPAARGSSRPR